MLFITSYSLISCSNIHNCSGCQKCENITRQLQITHTLFPSTADKMNVGQHLSHDQKEARAVKNMLSHVVGVFFIVISAMMFGMLIITTKLRRLKSVDLERKNNNNNKNKNKAVTVKINRSA